VLLATMLASSSGLLSSCTVRTKSPEHPKPVVLTTRAFKLTVIPPTPGFVGQELFATVKLVPGGEYKINLEYPHKLKVTGPQAATPQEVTLRSKQAAQLSASALVFKPVFKLSLSGNHTFEGTLRFSVCTDKLCEMKSRPVKWQARVAEQ
jgi:hypothetical protein